jgi:phosphatidylserine/phosphatidylglycerophosphate/cardiolipin synthase-like enzyme
VIVHSKVSVIDDRLVRAGSANLNNRSAGFDTECDLAIEAADDAARNAVLAFRDRLVAHFIAADPKLFAAMARELGLRGAIERLDTGPRRRLDPLDTGRKSAVEVIVSAWSIGDPISTEDAWRPWRRRDALQAHRDRLAGALLEFTPKSMISGR